MTETVTEVTKAKMLERVRKLLAKASAEGVTPVEARSLTAKAAELMAKYGIDKALAAARGHAKHIPTSKIFTCEAPYARIKTTMVHAIARAVHCSGVTLINRRSTVGRIQVYGFESDIEIIDMLYTSLLLQMSREVAALKFPSWVQGRQLMAERRSFMLGFIAVIEERLTDAYAVAVAEAEAENTGTTGTALVLASRDLAVKTLLGQDHPSLTKVRVSSSGTKYGAGQEAGRRANIHNSPETTGSSRAALR